MHTINALGVNPIDRQLYGSLQLDAVGSPTYLCRFVIRDGNMEVESFLGKFDSFTFSADFDQAGSYWYRDGAKIFVVDSMSQMSGAASVDPMNQNAGPPTLSEVLGPVHTITDSFNKADYSFSDNVVEDRVLAGKAGMRKLIIGVLPSTPHCKLYVLDVTDRNNAEEHILDINPEDPLECYAGGDGKGGFGAAW
eukprot:2083389-Amphidinium_carterae.1